MGERVRSGYIDGAALVAGYPAALLGRLLRDAVRAGALGGVSEQRRREVLDAIEAVCAAGERWRSDVDLLASTSVSTSAHGSSETPVDVDVSSSQLVEVITTREVAQVLGISERQVVNLAAAGEFGRKVGGRWVFERDEVDAARDRRAAS